MRQGVIAVAFFVPIGGCAVIAGVDQFQKGDCAGGDCGDAQMIPDGVSPKPDGASDASMTMDGTMSVDGADTDSALADSPTSDTGVDGCGPLNTVQNCTMCGAACDIAHSNGASCNGQTCQYQSCQMGWTNCDPSAPDLAGCECNSPSCCGNTCQTKHQNGIGQDFYDCVAQNTFNLVQAIEACTAYTGNSNLCMTTSCVNPKDLLVCGEINNRCACWDYSGVTPGHVFQSANKTCYCPGGNDPAWN